MAKSTPAAKVSRAAYPVGASIKQENQVIREAIAILEGRFRKLKRNSPVTSPDCAIKLAQLMIVDKENEHFWVAFLNSQHQLIDHKIMFTGTIDSAAVYPREVVKAALGMNAAAVLFAHNHPSGAPEPSTADEKITKRLKYALALMDIRVLDHLVIGAGGVVSMAKRGLM